MSCGTPASYQACALRSLFAFEWKHNKQGKVLFTWTINIPIQNVLVSSHNRNSYQNVSVHSDMVKASILWLEMTGVLRFINNHVSFLIAFPLQENVPYGPTTALNLSWPPTRPHVAVGCYVITQPGYSHYVAHAVCLIPQMFSWAQVSLLTHSEASPWYGGWQTLWSWRKSWGYRTLSSYVSTLRWTSMVMFNNTHGNNSTLLLSMTRKA